MDWFEGLPSVLAILAAAVGGCVLALVAARVLRLDCAIARVGAPAGPTPEEQVEQLAELADIAQQEGVLSLESRVAAMEDDFLIRGVNMAVEGAAPDEIRSALESEIDAANADFGAGRRLVLGLARMPQAATVCGAAAMLGVLAVYGADPRSARPAALVGLFLFVFGVTTGAVIGPVADRLAGRQASLIMARLLQAEAIALIRSGCTGATVEARLRAMLPKSEVAPRPLSKAA